MSSSPPPPPGTAGPAGPAAEIGSIRDLSTLRRRAAAEAVARFLDDLSEGAAGVPHRIVEGSAVAAQVRFTDEQLIRAVLRVDIAVRPAARHRYEAALRALGYTPGKGSGDVALMRIAGRRGRRPVHVLFEGTGAPPPTRHHPGSPEAAAERARRLSAAFRPILGSWRCTIERRGDEASAVTETIAETREVHLVADGDPPPAFGEPVARDSDS